MSQDLGTQYVHAAASGDFEALHKLFSDDIEFIGATPR